MRSILFCSFILCLILGVSTGRVPIKKYNKLDPYFFEQKLDHFHFDNRTFKQKYFVDDTYYTAGNPVFLYINGEGPISGPPNNAVHQIYAKEFGALVVTMEHRYYGPQSSPFQELTLDNLKYLSFQQALADLSLFITHIREEAQTNKVITFGCSYSGALSAWFRLKYPQLTLGSVSSSGVVNAILDFYEFDQQVSISVGYQCSDKLREITAMVEKELSGPNRNYVQSLFNVSNFDDGDFLYMVADMAAESAQYGFHYPLCDSIINKTGSDLLLSYANYCVNYYYNHFGGPSSYSWKNNLDLSVNGSNAASRCWNYQTCTELGYFQTAPKVGSLRSSRVNLEYFKDFCRKIYGEGIWADTAQTNAMFGGRNVQGTNILFINSSQDPWQRAGVLIAPNKQEDTAYVVCQDCGHCSDLRGCPSLPGEIPSKINSCLNMTNVNAVRAKTIQTVRGWLNDFEKNKN
eukprot:TRINITY_DN5194_c0_g1_i1.p1 TRINITY_DN5194_c0_g1~~TRINITY_DN5194_c0_g1_i1.p1  ORF type:complete len:461 (-),score=118.38 TRINITY_DN5194_c0_g1_i1:16-1398(-)